MKSTKCLKVVDMRTTLTVELLKSLFPDKIINKVKSAARERESKRARKREISLLVTYSIPLGNAINSRRERLKRNTNAYIMLQWETKTSLKLRLPQDTDTQRTFLSCTESTGTGLDVSFTLIGYGPNTVYDTTLGFQP